MQALRLIEDDHRALAAVLHGMRYLVRETRDRGAPPRFDVLGAMLYYIDAFPERVHHPRESEYLFRFLRARCPPAAPIIDQLEEEHRAGTEHIRALEQGLARYQHGGRTEFPAFASAVEAYVAFQHEHMRREERDILPLAKQHLLPSDWEVIDAAFTGGSVPRFGTDSPENFQKLFDLIVNLAPPPIGVGPAHA